MMSDTTPSRSRRRRRSRAQHGRLALVAFDEPHELPGHRVVIEDVAGRDLEDPAAHLELAGLEPARDALEGTQVLELNEHVFLHGGGDARLAVEIAVALGDQRGDAR